LVWPGKNIVAVSFKRIFKNRSVSALSLYPRTARVAQIGARAWASPSSISSLP
jgi:hypothetical protein